MKKAFFILSFLFIAAFILVFRPVPIVEENRCLVVSGIVSSVYESGVKDVSLELENTETRFYINRGLENGLDLKDLQIRLIGEEVVIKYPSYWTPLDPNDEVRHLSKLEFGEEVIFDETL